MTSDTGSGGPEHTEHADHDFTGPLSPPVARFISVFFVISAILFIADFFVDREVHQPAEKIPGFYAIYGFIGCVVLVLVAKQMRKVVMRDEDYYDEPAAGADADSPSEGGGGH